MGSELFDSAEVLVNHIDLVFAKLDLLRMMVGSNTALAEAVTKQGSDLLDVLRESSRQGGRPPAKPSVSHKKFAAEHARPLTSIVHITMYVSEWYRTARRTLVDLCNNSVDLDLRWNAQFTVRFCRIFVAMAKVIIYFFHFPMVRWGFLSASLLGDSSLITPERKHVCDFLATAAENPFLLLATQDNQIATHLGQLISQVGPVLMQVIGQWPLVDWQRFVIFNRAPAQTVDSTLPDLDHLCLANIPLLCDVTLLFTVAYPDFVSRHPQMRAIMQEMWTESPTFFITRSAVVPISVLLKAYSLGERHQVDLNDEQILYRQSIKSSISHNQRILHLLIILRDIVSLCEFDIAYLPKLTHEVLALSAFAFYELTIKLQDAKPGISTLQLLDELVKIGRLYLKYEENIARFFVFNLGSVDCSYLAQLCDQFSNGHLPWQQQLSSLFGALLYNLQTIIDLDEFDRGVRYDFTPFLATHSRILQFFNTVSLKQRTAYLHPFLEHLETIRIHINFAQSPVRAFLSYCPVHTMWSYIDMLCGYFKKESDGIYMISTIFELFAIFNLNFIPQAILEGEAVRFSRLLQTTRGELLNMFCRNLNSFLQPSTLLMKSVDQNRLDKPFKYAHYVNSPERFSMEFFENLTKEKALIWQLKELLFRLPGTVEFNGQSVDIARWIASKVTDNLPSILFKDIIPPHSLQIDQSLSVATQLLWPFYSALDSGFSLKVFNFRFENTCFYNQYQFLDLTNHLWVEFPRFEDPVQLARQKILVIVTSYLDTFLKSECFDALYVPQARRFLLAGDSPVATYFSHDALEGLIVNFGIHAAYALDHVLIDNAVQSISRIMTTFGRMPSELNAWLKDFRADGTKWLEGPPQLNAVAQEMVRLGVALTIRSLVRELTATVLNRSLPGVSALVASAQKRKTEELNEKEVLLVELLTTSPTCHFIEVGLIRLNITNQRATDITALFFFLGLVLGCPWFAQATYNPALGTLSKNLHLYPVALRVFVDLFRVLSVANDFQMAADAVGQLFTLCQQIFEKIRGAQGQEAASSFLLLVDMIPREITSIEYGKMTSAVPRNLILDAIDSLTKGKDERDLLQSEARQKPAKK